MHRVDNTTSIGSIPTPSAIGENPNSFFSDGDPQNAIPATVVDADWANALQEEIANVIEGAGITLNKTVRTQLKDAIGFMQQNSGSNYAASSGTNTYTATLSPAITAYTNNMQVVIKFSSANTGAATLNLNALGAKNIKLPNGNPLFGGDIPANHYGKLIYDGTNFILTNPDQITAKLGRKGTDIASATTTDLSAATGDFVDVTGTTTITGLGNASAAGIIRTVRFSGALILTHNASSLILPGGISINTASGDIAVFRSLDTSGNWICVSYSRASGAQPNINIKGTDIASAGTTDLSSATGDFIDITGTTTITAFGTVAAGIEKTLRFNGALTLTHNATSLILPGTANITTASGDTAIFRSLGSGNWMCINYKKANGQAVIGATASVTWTPGYTGFSGNPNISAQYQLIGKICFIYLLAQGNGTSNSVNFTMTGLPFTAAGISPLIIGLGTDNSAQTSCVGTISGTTITWSKGFVSSGGNWTASGNKSLSATFFYEIA